jgi:hypothetical protein
MFPARWALHARSDSRLFGHLVQPSLSVLMVSSRLVTSLFSPSCVSPKRAIYQCSARKSPRQNVTLVYRRRHVGKGELIKQALMQDAPVSIYYECKETSEENDVASLRLGSTGMTAPRRARTGSSHRDRDPRLQGMHLLRGHVPLGSRYDKAYGGRDGSGEACRSCKLRTASSRARASRGPLRRARGSSTLRSSTGSPIPNLNGDVVNLSLAPCQWTGSASMTLRRCKRQIWAFSSGG